MACTMACKGNLREVTVKGVGMELFNPFEYRTLPYLSVHGVVVAERVLDDVGAHVQLGDLQEVRELA